MNSNVKLRKDTDFHVRTNSMIKAAFDDLAGKEGLTTSEYIRRLLLEELKRKKVRIEVNEKIS